MSNQPDLAQKILKQIEYYFSDVNLSKDKFMQEEIQKDSGWVTLDTLIKFNRLKTLSTDFQVILDALKASDLLEINEADKKVRRGKPLPENLSEFEQSLKQNTAYVKGFPQTLSLDELLAFFEKYGKVLTVFMRRFPASKQFKGSVFVTFDSNDAWKKFLELTELKYNDQDLSKESQEDYLKRKGPEIKEKQDARAKREQEKVNKEKKRLEAEEAYLKDKQVPGAVLFIKGLNSEGTRENLKELFDSHAKVQWIDYSKGEPEAHVRFAEANAAKEAYEKALKAQGGDSLTLKGATLEVRVLEGDEETEFWKNTLRKQAQGRNQRNQHRSGGGRGGNKGGFKRNNFKRKKGGKGGDDDDDDDDCGNENEAVNGEKAAANDLKKRKLEGEEGVTA